MKNILFASCIFLIVSCGSGQGNPESLSTQVNIIQKQGTSDDLSRSRSLNQNIETVKYPREQLLPIY